jgi:ABC-type branched-subunit amino acid transport system ATPase component
MDPHPSPDVPLLRICNVEKSFGGIRAIDKCSAEVYPDSITGLIGPNGAGKTTLFDIITGLQRADAGEIWFKGVRIGGLPAHRIAKLGIARTFQVPRELRHMSVLENLMLAPAFQTGERLVAALFNRREVTVQERWISHRAYDVLKTVGLVDDARRMAVELSAGQKKLLELARTLMVSPTLVLLDEPGAGVNPRLLKSLIEVIRMLHKQGTSFLVIEHNMDLIMDLCDTVIVIDHGKTLTVGTPAEIRRDQRVLGAYLGSQG